MHLKETRADEPRVIYENLHFAFARMEDTKYKFSADEKAHVADSPFMQMMFAISEALPGMKIVVQFSSGVEIHVDYRHLHGTAEMVSPSHSLFSSHAAGSFRLSMLHARADSARRALPQGELQATVVGHSAAGYVSTEQVISGQTAMAARNQKTGAKFGPVKDGKANVLLLVPRHPGDVLFVTSNALAGLVTYPPRPSLPRQVGQLSSRAAAAAAVHSLCVHSRSSAFAVRVCFGNHGPVAVRSFVRENGELSVRQCCDGDLPVLHTGNTITPPELLTAVEAGKGNAAATMAAVTGASRKRQRPYWLMNAFPLPKHLAAKYAAAFQKAVLDFIAQWRLRN